jgi:hypothetical protein
MNLLDKVILEWSYRTKKGYPDINSQEDIALFESMFGIDLDEMAKKPFSNLTQQAQEVGKAIMNKLSIPQDEIASHAKNRIIVLTDIPRREVFQALGEMGFEKDGTITGSSGGGFRTPEGIEIIHKPKTLTALGGAGVNNENFVVEKIQNALENTSPLAVIFKSDKGPDLAYKGVTGISHIGKEGEKKGWKGDIALETSSGTRHISVKEDGPYRWESVMGRYKEFYQKFITNAFEEKYDFLKLVPLEENPRVLRMMNPANNKPYGRIFILNHPEIEKDTYSMAFGVDRAEIVQRSFEDSDFKLDGNTLTIHASKTMEDLKDFEKGDLPVIEFERNASKATKLDGPFNRGIVMRTSPMRRYMKTTERANNLVLNYDQIEL